MTRRSVQFLGAVLMFAIAALVLAPAAARGATPPAPISGEKVNINTAGVDELVTLPGIGKAYAARIVEYRQKNGPFKKDRKSTRLNSSHLVISYAVFCLKKKKNNIVACSEHALTH